MPIYDDVHCDLESHSLLAVCVTEHEGRRDQGLRETADEEADECEVAAGTRRSVEGVEGSEEGRHEEVRAQRKADMKR